MTEDTSAQFNAAVQQEVSRLLAESRRETRRVVAGGIAAGIASLIGVAAAGWWFFLEPKVREIVGGVPSDGVVAFDKRKCPNGWMQFEDGRGRFIVGTSNSLGWRQVGGSETHVLKTEELPPHSHALAGPLKKGEPGVTTAHVRVGGSLADKGTQETGGGKAFRLMPSYIPLTYCVKE